MGDLYLINYSWKQVLAIFSILGPPMDLILHIMVVQNVLQHLTMLNGHEWLINHSIIFSPGQNDIFFAFEPILMEVYKLIIVT